MIDIAKTINDLSTNQMSLYTSLIGAGGVMLAGGLAARVAFSQLKVQFQHKAIYESWTDLQGKLFAFSKALSVYSGKINGLHSYIKGLDAYFYQNDKNLVNTRWNEVNNAFLEVQNSFVAFIKAYENNEFMFVRLDKMRSAFREQYDELLFDQHHKLLDKIFPEMFGAKRIIPDEQLIWDINTHWTNTTIVGAYLDDFRKELQNETVGKVVGSKVPSRIPADGYTILTRKGVKVFRSRFSLPKLLRPIWLRHKGIKPKVSEVLATEVVQ
jgi:hypothetical protein